MQDSEKITLGEITQPTKTQVSRLEDTVRGEVGAPNIYEMYKGTASYWKRVSLGLLPRKRVSPRYGTASYEACFPYAKND